MVDILIQPPELRQISEQLRTSAQKIAAAMQAIDDAISSLKGDNFLGNRSNNVQANYAPKREALLTAKNIILHFAEDLKNTANIFEQADRSDGRKKILYLVNGINYDGSEGSLKALQGKIKQQYGDNVEVRIVGAHPYDSNLQQYKTNLEKHKTNLGGTHFGGWFKPVDWITGGGAAFVNKSTKLSFGAIDTVSETGLGLANTVYGVGQVASEYITGGSVQSQKVYNWIQKDLSENGLIDSKDLDIVLVGHSGGGAIVANIVDDVENKLGVNVSGMVTMGSPLSNYDHASKYAETIIDIEHKGDGIGRIANFGPIRSDENRYLIPGLILAPIPGIGQAAGVLGLIGGDGIFRDSSNNIQSIISTDSGYGSWGDAHGSYWNSPQVVDAIGSVL